MRCKEQTLYVDLPFTGKEMTQRGSQEADDVFSVQCNLMDQRESAVQRVECLLEEDLNVKENILEMSCNCKSHARALIHDQHEGRRFREAPQKGKWHLETSKKR